MLSDDKHCDDYIYDPSAPVCLRWWLWVNRLPARDYYLVRRQGINPRLFATYNDRRYQVVTASRLGDVGITQDFSVDASYALRVSVAELSAFSDKP